MENNPGLYFVSLMTGPRLLPSLLLSSVRNRGAHIRCVNRPSQRGYCIVQRGYRRHSFEFLKWLLAGSGLASQVWTTEMYHSF